jgi:hypothetical protein
VGKDKMSTQCEKINVSCVWGVHIELSNL